MLPSFEHVPYYPFVFALFWGAAGLFALAMARHLRIFAATRATGPSFLDNVPARVAGLIEYAFIQTKMFKDPRAGLMHAGIFWGFVLLTIGTANIVTGGVIQAVLSAGMTVKGALGPVKYLGHGQHNPTNIVAVDQIKGGKFVKVLKSVPKKVPSP